MQQNESEKHRHESADKAQSINSKIVFKLYAITLLALIIGVGTAYLLWGKDFEITLLNPTQANPSKPLQSEIEASEESASEFVNLIRDVNMPESYTLANGYGDIGPRLIASGAIDLDRFVQVFQDAGQPLTEDQLAILTEGSDKRIEFNKDNSYFLLNLFWAFGLTSNNEILLVGPMMNDGMEQIGRFASTGGWAIGTKPPTDLYASEKITELTEEQQERLVQVASIVYRPCCDNPTLFPDCNHGMAMLGILELMASSGASIDEMFEAAKYINAFWFPQQSFEIAMYLNIAEGISFDEIRPKRIVGRNYFSSSGYRLVHQQLLANNMLEIFTNGGISCGV